MKDGYSPNADAIPDRLPHPREGLADTADWLSLLKIPFGRGTGFPTETSVDDSRLSQRSVVSFCDLSTMQEFRNTMARAQQLQTATALSA
jgi:hypothetical protein